MTPLYALDAFGLTVNLYPDLSYDMGEIDPRVIRAYAALAGDDESAAERFANDHLRDPIRAVLCLLAHVALPMFAYRDIGLMGRADATDMGSRFLNLRVSSSGGLAVAYCDLWFTSLYKGGHAFSATPLPIGEGYAPQCPLLLSYAPRSVAVPYKGKHGWGVQVAREVGRQ